MLEEHDTTYDQDTHADYVWHDPAHAVSDEEIAEAAELDVSGIGKIPSDALRVFVQMLLPVGDCTRAGYWKTATIRLVSLAHAIGTDGVTDISLSKIATALGCTRASLSLYAVRLRDYGHLSCKAGKSDAARQAYADRARSVWAARKEPKTHAMS